MSLSEMWSNNSDMSLAEFEPSSMVNGICPWTVFDKFDWDRDTDCSNLLGPESDELLDKFMKSEPEDILDDKIINDYGSLMNMFPEFASPYDDFMNISNDTIDIKTEPADISPVPIPLPVPSNEVQTEVKTEVVEEKESNSIIRIPVKRSPGMVNPNFSKSGTGRTVKAVVVCPDRTKSIVCNVVRSANSKSIVIQKPVGRSLLNICNQRSESKLPIKVNVITPKDGLAIGKVKTKFEPDVKIENNDVKIKMEFEEVRPETPQSLVSEEDYHPFTSPCKADKSFDGQDNFIKSCLMEEDYLYSDSFKLVPPAEVTGQMQPNIPDVFKYTPNSSPTNNNDQCDMLDTFYSKIGSQSSSQTQFYNKAAANVDHDYGFTCRTPMTTNIFCTDSLGIQTPSASEPPTDSDDDDVNILNDSIMLNRAFECTELQRVQQEYFDDLSNQLQKCESVKEREKEKKLQKKSAVRNRKRKLPSSKERSEAMRVLGKADSKISTNASTGLLKVRLPVKDVSNPPKRRKPGSGGRVFSPSERHLHNTNEQVRRIEMRQSFEELRRLIPKLYDKPRAPKVSILQEAKAYCDELYHDECNMQAQTMALKSQQERLRMTLSQLRRSVAASRY